MPRNADRSLLRLTIQVGEIAVRDSRLVRIDERLDGDRVKVRGLATGECSEVPLSSLQGRSALAESASIDAHLEVTRASTDVAWRRARPTRNRTALDHAGDRRLYPAAFGLLCGPRAAVDHVDRLQKRNCSSLLQYPYRNRFWAGLRGADDSFKGYRQDASGCPLTRIRACSISSASSFAAETIHSISLDQSWRLQGWGLVTVPSLDAHVRSYVNTTRLLSRKNRQIPCV